MLERSRTGQGNPEGFTLVEVSVVLIILAIMGALAVPALRNYVQEDDMSAATRTVELLFKIARDSAVRSAAPVTVWIDSASGGVWLVAARDTLVADSVTQAERVGTTLVPGEPLELPTSVKLELSKARARFRFAASGAVFADSLTLHSAGETRLITLNPWTGDVVK
jgi:prepilin-type N-terminal cleavage/methylation domain-containing protein